MKTFSRPHFGNSHETTINPNPKIKWRKPLCYEAGRDYVPVYGE